MRMPDVQLLSGEDVVVVRRSVGYDENMDKVESEEREDVGNVLVAPGSTVDVQDSSRPDGAKAAFTLGFPKWYGKSLRGCGVVVRGREYRVIGDPQPNSEVNCPTPWWYTAQVEDVDG